MKKKIIKLFKNITGRKYNYYKLKIKNIKRINTKRYINDTQYNNEEIIIASVDNPNKGVSVGGKHIHINLLQEGLLVNKEKNYLLTCRNKNSYNYKLEELCTFYGLSISEFKRIEDIEFAYLVFDWIYQLKEEIKLILKRDNKVKVINCHDIISTIAISEIIDDFKLNIPIVTTLHGYFSDENVDYGGLKKDSYLYKFFKELERKAYERSTRIIAVDTRIKKYVLSEVSIFKEDNIKVIKNAINEIKFKPINQEEKEELLEKYSLLENTLFVPRRLVPKNGVLFVVEAVNELVNSGFEDFKLVIAGDGVQRQQIEKYIYENNLNKYINLLGDITHDKILEYFKASKIVIVPSVPSNNVEEATSLAALEGMAVGKITIATEIGGLKELIENDYNGYLVKPNDVKDLALNISKALKVKEDIYNEITKNARKTVIEKHGYINHSLEFYKVFKEAIEEYNENTNNANMVL